MLPARYGSASLEGRRDNLSQANKLSRIYAVLLDALNRHRGKGGQQKVTVEHVYVHAGGQAVVGVVECPGGGDRPISDAGGQASVEGCLGGGDRPISEDQPHAKQIVR